MWVSERSFVGEKTLLVGGFSHVMVFQRVVTLDMFMSFERHIASIVVLITVMPCDKYIGWGFDKSSQRINRHRSVRHCIKMEALHVCFVWKGFTWPTCKFEWIKFCLEIIQCLEDKFTWVLSIIKYEE